MKSLKCFLMSSLLLLAAACSTKDPITIYMIGDSTMANKVLRDGNQERGWGQMLPEVLTQDIRVDNHAVNGRSSLSFINEGRWDTVMARVHPGDYVFIQFGHNDEKPDEKRHTDPGSTFDDNLRRFVSETREKGAYPVLFNSIVRRNFQPTDSERKGNYDIEGDSLVDTHGAYLESPRNVAKEMNVPFVDMNRLTHELVCTLGRERSKDLYMWIPAGVYDFCPNGKIDNTHLKRWGAKVMAGIVMESVAEEVPALAKYLLHYRRDIYVADYPENKLCAVSYVLVDSTENTSLSASMDKLLKDSWQTSAWLKIKTMNDTLVASIASDTTIGNAMQRQGIAADEVWLATPCDVAAYETARRNTILNINETADGFTIQPKLSSKNGISSLTMVLKIENASSMSVIQDGKDLSVKTVGDACLFDFNPCGGKISIAIRG